MSTDYDIKCMKCGQSLEVVASDSIAYGRKLWTNGDSLARLRVFLFAHVGHPLVFDDGQKLEDEGAEG